MRRSLLFFVLLAAIGVALFASNVVSVRIQPPAPDGVSASPFWREKSEVPELPPAVRVWVDLAKAVRPAVVNVSTTQKVQRTPLGDEFFRRFFPREPAPSSQARTSLGSGFIIAADGMVATNFHVVREAAEIVVRLADQREFAAKLVGSDPKADIALLRIEARDLPTLVFGDSDRLEVGEAVMAVGNPFGLDQTVTTGIVSAKERFIGSGPYDDFIQTDASINPGNSGGPLVDARGALIGINTAIFSQNGGWNGIGFAIPVNVAKEVLPQLRAGGHVTRGYLGVAVGPVPADAAARAKGERPPRGALVAEVVPRSPAASAGLDRGDVIEAFQGAPVQNPHELTRRVAGTPPGTRVTLDVARDGTKRTVSATLGRLPDEDAPPPAR